MFNLCFIYTKIIKKKVLSNYFIKHENIKRDLGRWKITYDIEQMDKRIDLANEDHCGPCGKYILQKQENLKIDDDNIKIKQRKK